MIEYPQAYREKRRKSRKEHKCSECLGKITVGEIYLYISGIWDSEPASYKQCFDCESLIKEINSTRKDYDEKVYLTGLIEECSCNSKYRSRFISIAEKRASSFKFIKRNS